MTTLNQLDKISGSVKLHISDSWGRKVTTRKCPHINVLNVETDHMEKFQINDLPKFGFPVF